MTHSQNLSGHSRARAGSTVRLVAWVVVAVGACVPPKQGDSGPPTETSDTTSVGPTLWTSVSAGFYLACGIREDEMIQCWGGEAWEDRYDYDWSDYDEDDPPAGNYVKVHLPVAEGDTFGGWHGCATTTDGAVVCWGRNGSGEASPPAGAFADIATDIELSCGLTDAGSPVCWGEATDTPTEIAARAYTSIDVDWGGACALRGDGQVDCWLPGESRAFDVPKGVFTDFEYQDGEFCTIDQAGSLACWYAQPAGHSESSLGLPPEGFFTDVCVGGTFACAADESGLPRCWGNMDYWEVEIPAEPLAAISCGYGNACGVTPDQRILCWGSNSLGQADVPY